MSKLTVGHTFSSDKEMIDTINPQHIIFAANSTPPAKVLELFRNKCMPLVVLLGSWEHNLEQSYLCEFDMLGMVRGAGFLKGEECIMLLGSMDGNNGRSAVLVYSDERPSEYIGQLKQVPASEAEHAPAYSYDAQRCQYFVVT